MIHYYTEFLGMKDTIQEEDLYVDVSKTELERQMEDLRKDLTLKDERHRAEINNIKKEFSEVIEEMSKKFVGSGEALKLLKSIKKT